MPYYKFLFYLSLLFLIISCNPDDGPQIDESAPEIEIFAPQDGATFEAGALVPLRVDISDNVEMHEYSISLVNLSTNNVTVIDFGHQHDALIQVDKEFQLPPSSNRMYEIRVEASDHDENSNSVNISINVN